MVAILNVNAVDVGQSDVTGVKLTLTPVSVTGRPTLLSNQDDDKSVLPIPETRITDANGDAQFTGLLPNPTGTYYKIELTYGLVNHVKYFVIPDDETYQLADLPAIQLATSDEFSGRAQSSGGPGPVGPIGPQGVPGVAGSAGPQGARGPTGATGPRGPTGPKGDKGDKGDTGDQGSAGSTGPRGQQGERGLRGEQGDPGPKGDTGDKGDQGDPGATGPQGIRGPQGIQGSRGPKGDQGDRGNAGPVGPKGDKGDKGDPGATGPAGPKGDPGITGPAGAKGDKGDTGATGPAGPTGPIGPKGDKGDKGDTGATGPKGDKGDTGPAGQGSDQPDLHIQKDVENLKKLTQDLSTVTRDGDYVTATDGTIWVQSPINQSGLSTLSAGNFTAATRTLNNPDSYTFVVQIPNTEDINEYRVKTVRTFANMEVRTHYDTNNSDFWTLYTSGTPNDQNNYYLAGFIGDAGQTTKVVFTLEKHNTGIANSIFDGDLGATPIEQVQDAVNSLIVAGTNITKNYNDATGKLTLNSTAAGTAGRTANSFLRRGNWTTGQSYVVGDVVFHATKNWYCRTAHTSASGNSPEETNGSFWVAFASDTFVDNRIEDRVGDLIVAGRNITKTVANDGTVTLNSRDVTDDLILDLAQTTRTAADRGKLLSVDVRNDNDLVLSENFEPVLAEGQRNIKTLLDEITERSTATVFRNVGASDHYHFGIDDIQSDGSGGPADARTVFSPTHDFVGTTANRGLRVPVLWISVGDNPDNYQIQHIRSGSVIHTYRGSGHYWRAYEVGTNDQVVVAVGHYDTYFLASETSDAPISINIQQNDILRLQVGQGTEKIDIPETALSDEVREKLNAKAGGSGTGNLRLEKVGRRRSANNNSQGQAVAPIEDLTDIVVLNCQVNNQPSFATFTYDKSEIAAATSNSPINLNTRSGIHDLQVFKNTSNNLAIKSQNSNLSCQVYNVVGGASTSGGPNITRQMGTTAAITTGASGVRFGTVNIPNDNKYYNLIINDISEGSSHQHGHAIWLRGVDWHTLFSSRGHGFIIRNGSLWVDGAGNLMIQIGISQTFNWRLDIFDYGLD